MARKLDDILAELPQERRDRIEARTMELATLKELRQAAELRLDYSLMDSSSSQGD